MRILVYGAGVLGSLYAAKLKEAGNHVTVLARGKRLADIREHGIVLQELITGKRSATSVNVVQRLARDDAYDLVMVLVRKDQLAGVLPSLSANRGTHNVLFMMNNASGPAEMVALLGRDRVLLGFAGAGGWREGNLVRFTITAGMIQKTTLGELDGRKTQRIERIACAFRRAGFPVALSSNMDAWLKTHAVLVSSTVNAVYMAEGSISKLARMKEGVRLMVKAVKEGLKVLKVKGIPITPIRFRLLNGIPDAVLIWFLRSFMKNEKAETLMASHANTARDEMKCIADELKDLARTTSCPTPAADELYKYI